jgi:hypothetical protein
MKYTEVLKTKEEVLFIERQINNSSAEIGLKY